MVVERLYSRREYYFAITLDRSFAVSVISNPAGFWKYLFWLCNYLITLKSVILRHLEAELSILRCLKLIKRVIYTF
jgi:hypothetical protein